MPSLSMGTFARCSYVETTKRIKTHKVKENIEMIIAYDVVYLSFC